MTASLNPTRRLVSLAVACVALTLWVAPVQAQKGGDVPSKQSDKFLSAFRAVVSKPSASVVRILCDGKEAALATVVGADGWVLTKASELSGKTVCKFKDGRQLEARIVGVQEKYDLALLKVEATNLTPVEWVDSKNALAGNWVASVGTGADPVAVGVVSVPTRTLPDREQRVTPNPASGFLGISLEPSTGGPKISMVTRGSAADKAGIKVNDQVVSLGGKIIEDPESLMSFMSRTKPGQTLVIKIKRGGEHLELKATLAKREADRSDFQNRMGSELSNRRYGFPTFLQHDTIIKPKDCGGPLVDLDGKVIAVNVSRTGRVESYAIPSEVILTLLPELKSGKLDPVALEAEAQRVAHLEDKVREAQTALDKALADKTAVEKRIEEAKKALEKAKAEAKAVKKDK